VTTYGVAGWQTMRGLMAARIGGQTMGWDTLLHCLYVPFDWLSMDQVSGENSGRWWWV
jgi:hypothetical protein